MFFSNKNLSPSEIDDAMNKITKIYTMMVEKYGTHFFNYQDFRTRYLETLKKKGNMGEFFKVEWILLEKREKMAQDHLRKVQETLGSTEPGAIEKTFENIIARTDDYPEVPMGDRSNTEIRRLVGMCRLIYPELMNVSVYVPPERNTLFYQEIKSIQDVVEEPFGFSYKSYIESLGNDFLPQSQLDKIGQKLIKEIAVALQTILSILKMTDPVKVGHIVDYISKAISDFRLDIFQGRI